MSLLIPCMNFSRLSVWRNDKFIVFDSFCCKWITYIIEIFVVRCLKSHGSDAPVSLLSTHAILFVTQKKTASVIAFQYIYLVEEFWQ